MYDPDDPRHEYDPYEDPYFGNRVMRDLKTYFVNGQPTENLIWAIRYQMRQARIQETIEVLCSIPTLQAHNREMAAFYRN